MNVCVDSLMDRSSLRYIACLLHLNFHDSFNFKIFLSSLSTDSFMLQCLHSRIAAARLACSIAVFFDAEERFLPEALAFDVDVVE